ncbi:MULTISPECIES: sensor domain-containing diguanylate cyclase [Gordonibacter]|uniref:GGDEF domain-containing protein n=1 Tax=Gordonibacter faecis TaxID=3047475 RepID=A0ABT7DKL3_9ACTN|nr:MULTISPECIES: GGDEF domain-containing protein [unclassified Gordonibacter]MDJ1650070.1 GGDEF domain-containing protein [Gordonibacter sp. KGMB12511]
MGTANESDHHHKRTPRRPGAFSARALAILVSSILLVAAVVAIVFDLYSMSLSDEFNKMSAEGMNDFTTAQKVEVEASIREVSSSLSTIRTLAEASDIDPEGAAFANFLAAWNERRSYQVTYASIESLKEGLKTSAIPERDEHTLELLENGESIVSDVRKSHRLNGYYYSIAEPVVKEGHVVGVLRSIVDARGLVTSTQVKSQISFLGSLLIKNDGTIVAVSQDMEPLNGRSLYDLLQDYGFDEAEVQRIRDNVENDYDVATIPIGWRDGRTVFFTSVRLNVNGWSIANFTEEASMTEHSQVILRDMVAAGSVLIVISAAACIAVALVLSRFRQKARRESERYAVLSEFTDTVLFEYSYADDVMELSPNARSVFTVAALKRTDYLKNGTPLVVVHAEDVQKIKELLENPAPEGEVHTLTLQARSATGEYRWYTVKCRYLYESDVPYAAVGKMVDVTQQRAVEEQLTWRSQIDGLTKALNKVTTEERVNEVLDTCEAGRLFVIDVDRFKQVNDRYGHSMGDRVLAGVARVLFEVFRQDDPVGRVGGDEFIVFAPGLSSEEAAEEKKEALRVQLVTLGRELGVSSLSASVGTARYPEDGARYEELFDVADRAMYRAKHARS